MGKKTKTEKTLFDVAHRQTDEYRDEHKVKKIDEFKNGPCEDEDRDVPMLSGFGATEDLDTLGAEGRHMRTDHFGDIGSFLESCPHLDAVRALELLSELSLKKAIEKGEKMVMIPRGFVANWVVTQIDDPTDRYFRKADAEHKKFVREVRKLGEAYEPAPVQKINDLKNCIIDAADPAKIDECYKRVNWTDALEAERKLAAKLLQAKQKKTKKGKKISKKGKNLAIKKIESKKTFKSSANNKKYSKLKVKDIKKSGKKGKNTKCSKTKKTQNKKGSTNASTSGEYDGAGYLFSAASRTLVKSMKKQVTSKKSASSSKRSSGLRKVSTAKKSGTKVKKVMKKIRKSKENKHNSTTGERDRVIPSSSTSSTKKSTKSVPNHVTSEMSTSSSKAKSSKNNCPRKISPATKNDTKVKKVNLQTQKKNNGTLSSAISTKTASQLSKILADSKKSASLSQAKSKNTSGSKKVSTAGKKGTEIKKVKKSNNKNMKTSKVIKK